MKAHNTFRHAIVAREQALAESERVFAARQAAYAAEDATAETLAAADAEQDRAELALDNAQDVFEAAMHGAGYTEVPDAIARALGGRTFDPATGDLR